MDISARTVQDETLILDCRVGLIHELNGTAGYIWEHCDGRATVEAIAGQLAEAFQIDPATAMTAVRTTVERLYSLDLLEPSRQQGAEDCP